MRIECSIIVQDVDELEFMADTDFVIVRIVRRCNLHGTCSELHVDYSISDDGYLACWDERMANGFSVQMLRESISSRPKQ